MDSLLQTGLGMRAGGGRRDGVRTTRPRDVDSRRPLYPRAGGGANAEKDGNRLLTLEECADGTIQCLVEKV